MDKILDLIKYEMGMSILPEDLPAECSLDDGAVGNPAQLPRRKLKTVKPERRETNNIKPTIKSIKIIKPANKKGEGNVAREGVSGLQGRLRLHLPTETEEETDAERKEQKWTDVVRRKGRNSKDKEEGSSSAKKVDTSKRNTRIRRLPLTEAVNIACPPGGYSEVMAEARSQINLADLGITDGVVQRTTRAGNISLVINGENRASKADMLAEKMIKVLENKEGVRVYRPMIRSELLISDFGVTMNKEDLAEAIVRYGQCNREEVIIGKITIGPDRRGAAWARCPAVAANRILSWEGNIVAGWARVKVTLLKPRSLQCYKCLEYGHVKAECRNNKDRSNSCYRCGAPGHLARDCDSEARCPVCSGHGIASDHRMGSATCVPPKVKVIGKPITIRNQSNATATAEKGERIEEEACTAMEVEVPKIARPNSPYPEDSPVRRKRARGRHKSQILSGEDDDEEDPATGEAGKRI